MKTFWSFLNPSELNAEDESKRLMIELWDWDRASRDDFMGALSFGVSEIIRRPVDCWFKLLSKEEGEFYSIPCFDAKTSPMLNMLKPKYGVSPHFINAEMEIYMSVIIHKNCHTYIRL